MNIDIDLMRSLFRYEPETGKLYRLTGKRAGMEAGFDNGNGYRRVALDRQKFYTHQIVWALMHGEQPPAEIDHKDGDRANNRIENLRASDRFSNMQNSPKRSHSLQPYKGVRRTRAGRWAARIIANKRSFHLGTFDTAEIAHLAYRKAATHLHGEFKRFG